MEKSDRESVKKIRDAMIGNAREKEERSKDGSIHRLLDIFVDGSSEERKCLIEILGSLGEVELDRGLRTRIETLVLRELEISLETKENLLPLLRTVRCIIKEGESMDRALSSLLKLFCGERERVVGTHKSPISQESLSIDEVLFFFSSLVIRNGVQEKFRTREFFAALNEHIEKNGYWVFVLFSLLVDRKSVEWIDIERIRREVDRRESHDRRKDTLGLMSLGLSLVHKLEDEVEEVEVIEEAPKEITFSWNMGRRERMGSSQAVRKEERVSGDKYDLYRTVESLFDRRKEMLVLETLSQIALRNRGVQKHIREMGFLKRAAGELLELEDLERVRYVEFINSSIEGREECRKEVMGLGFVDEVVRMVEKRIEAERYDVLLLSGLSTLKIISRSSAIVKGDLGAYPIVEIIERVLDQVLVDQEALGETEVPETMDYAEPILIESFLFLGNILLVNNRWKSIFIGRNITSKVSGYLKNRRMERPLFLLLKNLLYEDDSSIKESILLELGIEFFRMDVEDRPVESRVEYYGIVRNLLFNNRRVMESLEKGADDGILSLIPWYLEEFRRTSKGYLERLGGSSNSGSSSSIEPLVKEILYILVNISALGVCPERVGREDVIGVAAELFKKGGWGVKEACLWYFINLSWNKESVAIPLIRRAGVMEALEIDVADPVFQERLMAAKELIRRGG
jgi:hypothetical protein